VSGERPRMRWWIPLAAVVALVVAANAGSLVLQQRARAARIEPSLVIIRPPVETSCLALDGTTLYAGGLDGVWSIDTRTMRASRPWFAGKVDFGHVRGLAEFDGALWVGHEHGLTRIAGTSIHTYTTADGLPAQRVQCLLVRPTPGGSELWVGTEGGAARLTGGILHALTVRDGLASDMVNALGTDPHGGLWLGSYVAPAGGISWMSGEAVRKVFTPADGLPHADVTCITPMPDGEVWVGVGFDDRGGLAIFDSSDATPRLVRTLSRADGLPGDKVRSITRLADGTILVGSERDGLLVRTSSGDRILTVEDGLSDDEVKIALQSPDGRVWLGTRNGVTVMTDAAALVHR
jgi:ligand-binding sensor domain-containing protein